MTTKRQGVGEVRKVTINKEPSEGLGISITVSVLMYLQGFCALPISSFLISIFQYKTSISEVCRKTDGQSRDPSWYSDLSELSTVGFAAIFLKILFIVCASQVELTSLVCFVLFTKWGDYFVLSSRRFHTERCLILQLLTSLNFFLYSSIVF